MCLQATIRSWTNVSAAIVLAAEHGHAPAVKALLSAGADVQATDSDGNTALACAALKGRVTVVQALLAAGAPKATAYKAQRL